MTVSAALIRVQRETFRLDWNGIHGASHWARVRDNGLKLAPLTGARVDLIEYFAFLHDSCRISDRGDPGHGPRAAQLAKELRHTHIALDDSAFDQLLRALEGHTGGDTPGDETIATCWDADRLDLGRIAVIPDPRFLVTQAAREPQIIGWALARSLAWRTAHHRRRRRHLSRAAHPDQPGALL